MSPAHSNSHTCQITRSFLHCKTLLLLKKYTKPNSNVMECWYICQQEVFYSNLHINSTSWVQFCSLQQLRLKSTSYNGMLPCFLCGLVRFLVDSRSKSWQILQRVVLGSMMSSTKPEVLYNIHVFLQNIFTAKLCTLIHMKSICANQMEEMYG